MSNKILIWVILLMTTGISAAYAQNRESKIFCPQLNDTVAIERTELNVRIFRSGEVKTFRNSFVFPARDSNEEYASATLVI